jgi:hypothetical protein
MGDTKAAFATGVEVAGETWPNGDDGIPDQELFDGTLSR